MSGPSADAPPGTDLLAAVRKLVPEPKSILFVGVGDGVVAKALLKAHPDVYLVAIDPDVQVVEEAAVRLMPGRVRIVQAEPRELPGCLGFDGSEGSFNVVLAPAGTVALPDPVGSGILQAIAALLAPGGGFLAPAAHSGGDGGSARSVTSWAPLLRAAGLTPARLRRPASSLPLVAARKPRGRSR